MSTKAKVKRDVDETRAMERLNLGGSINYGARMPSGNFVHLEIWRDPMGFRYSFTWQVKPSVADLVRLEEFKTRVSQDLCDQLDIGIKAIHFPNDHTDNAELTVAT